MHLESFVCCWTVLLKKGWENKIVSCSSKKLNIYNDRIQKCNFFFQIYDYIALKYFVNILSYNEKKRHFKITSTLGLIIHEKKFDTCQI